MNQTAVEWLKDTLYPYLNKEDKEYTDTLFRKAKEMEAKQRQADTNYGYSQGYDDGAQGKEPMQPEISNSEEQSYQDKMKDKIAKAKSRLK